MDFLFKAYGAKEEFWKLDEEKYKSIIPKHLRLKNWEIDSNDGITLSGNDLLNWSMKNDFYFKVFRNYK